MKCKLFLSIIWQIIYKCAVKSCLEKVNSKNLANSTEQRITAKKDLLMIIENKCIEYNINRMKAIHLLVQNYGYLMIHELWHFFYKLIIQLSLCTTL